MGGGGGLIERRVLIGDLQYMLLGYDSFFFFSLFASSAFPDNI